MATRSHQAVLADIYKHINMAFGRPLACCQRYAHSLLQRRANFAFKSQVISAAIEVLITSVLPYFPGKSILKDIAAVWSIVCVVFRL